MPEHLADVPTLRPERPLPFPGVNFVTWQEDETTFEARRLTPGRMWRVQSKHGTSSMSSANLLAELARGLLAAE